LITLIRTVLYLGRPVPPVFFLVEQVNMSAMRKVCFPHTITSHRCFDILVEITLYDDTKAALT